jgi:hypothetical protein
MSFDRYPGIQKGPTTLTGEPRAPHTARRIVITTLGSLGDLHPYVGQVYQVRREALPVLEKNHINYRKATIAEVSFCRDISKHHLFRSAVARSRGPRGIRPKTGTPCAP